MSAPTDDQLGFAPDDDAPIPYMQRTREYYAAIGYTTPYRWAHCIEAPFTPLRTPLAKARLTIITTAAPYRADKGDQGPGAPYNGGAKFYEPYSGDTAEAHDLRISHIGYDRTHTTATDSNTWFPLPALQRAKAAGLIDRVPTLVPITTAEYPSKARRPAYSVLDGTKFQAAFGLHLPAWQQGLDAVIGELAEQRN